MLSTEIFHPSKALWYRASICPRTSQDRCCNSISKPMRLSFNILMISKLLRLIRTSSNSGTSHSRSTICVCSNLMTPCNFSISIIRPRSCSFSASYTALSLLRSLDLSLASILGKTIAKFLDTQISRFQTRYSGFKLFKQVNFYKHFTHASVTRQVVEVLTCPNTSLVSPGPTPNSACESSHLPTSLCLSQTSCRSSHLSKHLTCVSRTHSQPQPVEIYSSTSQKHVVSGNQLTSHIHQMT